MPFLLSEAMKGSTAMTQFEQDLTNKQTAQLQRQYEPDAYKAKAEATQLVLQKQGLELQLLKQEVASDSAMKPALQEIMAGGGSESDILNKAASKANEMGLMKKALEYKGKALVAEQKEEAIKELKYKDDTAKRQRGQVYLDALSKVNDPVEQQRLLFAAQAEFPTKPGAPSIAQIMNTLASQNGGDMKKAAITMSGLLATQAQKTEESRSADRQARLDAREAERDKQRKEDSVKEDRRDARQQATFAQQIKLIGLHADEKTKAGVISGREARYADTLQIAANEAQTSIHNLMTMPITVTAGIFGSEHGGSKGDLFGAPIAALKNKMTTSDVQRYNSEISNVGKYYSTMLTGGMVTGATKAASDQFTEQFRIKEGDTESTKLQKLAQMRQTFEKVVDVKLKSRATPPEQMPLWNEMLANVRRDIPITVEDVNKLAHKGSSKELIGSVIKRKEKEAAALKTEDRATIESTLPSGWSVKEK